MATMLVQNLPPNGCAGAAPTFTMSDAPVYQPVASSFPPRTVKGLGGVVSSSGFLRPQETSDNSNRTNSTNVSSQTSSNNGCGPDVSLDIEKVKNTYYMNANRKLISSFISGEYSRAEFTGANDTGLPLTTDPKIRVSLDQTCCAPGETLEGSIFCDLSVDCEAIGPFGLCENMEEEIKLLVTFYGVERATIAAEEGEIFSKERDVYRKTKEIGCFHKSMRKGMHNFSFAFELPKDLPASCNVHSCHLGKSGGVGSITYSVVATLQGSVGIVSLQGNGSIVVRDLGETNAETSMIRSSNKGSRNSSVKILRFLNADKSHKQSHSKYGQRGDTSGRAKQHSKSMPHVFLEKDVVSLGGSIDLHVNVGRIKHGLVKAKKLSVKLIRIVELHTDEMHQRWESTEFEQSFDVRRRISIDLCRCENRANPLRSSTNSQLVVNKYVVQVRAKTSLGGFLGGPSHINLPVHLISEESCDVLFTRCDGVCQDIKHVVHLKPKDFRLEERLGSFTPTAKTLHNQHLRRVQSLENLKSPRDPADEKERLLRVNNNGEKEIIETKLLAVEIARQQLLEAKNRTVEAECELRETIKTMAEP